MEWYPQSIQDCAPWSYVLLCGQVVLLSVLVERTVFINFRARLNTAAFLEQVRKLVLAGNIDRALKLCQALGNAPMGEVCRAGLQAFEGGPFALQEALDRALSEQIPSVRRRLSRMPIIALGLVVVGLVGSKLLGADMQPQLGGDGPLPLGLDMPYAPALIGLTSGVIGLLGWLWLSAAAGKAIAGLEQCKDALLDLRGQVKDPGG